MLLPTHTHTEKERAVYKYLLEHPRRCYTLLFPTTETLWLTTTLIAFNLTQFVVFTGVEWNKPLLEGLDTGEKLENAVFSAITTRNCGFNTLNYAILQPSTEVLIIVMMYLGVTPITVALRKTDVGAPGVGVEMDIEGRPIATTAKNTDQQVEDLLKQNACVNSSHSHEEKLHQQEAKLVVERASDVAPPTIGFQARKLLTTHAAFLVIIIWIIALVEGDNLLTNPGFSMFSLVFEVRHSLSLYTHRNKPVI